MTKPKSISLSDKEIELLENYQKKFGLSRSAVIRLIINDFFLKNREANH